VGLYLLAALATQENPETCTHAARMLQRKTLKGGLKNRGPEAILSHGMSTGSRIPSLSSDSGHAGKYIPRPIESLSPP